MVYNVAGYGDSIQFARYLPVLTSLGAKVLCKVQTPLVELFRKSNLNAEIFDESTDENELKYDFQASFLYLPALFKPFVNEIPHSKGYLNADPDKVKIFKDKYFDNNLFKIGIVWRSGNDNGYDRKKSISNVNYFSPIARLDGVKLYSLQKGESTLQLNDSDIDIVNLGDKFEDFSDTAAAIENLDLVITVDTSTVHLAGALGKKIYLLLSSTAEWRWLNEGETTDWYDSVRLFRQTEPENWSDVIENIKESVTKLINQENSYD